MKWLRRLVALLLTCVALALPLVVLGQLTSGPNGVGFFALGLFLVPAGLAGGVLVGLPGLLWLDRDRPASPWPGIWIGAPAGAVALVAAFASMDALDSQGPAPDLALALAILVLGGAVIGVVGTIVFRAIERGLERIFTRA